MNAAIYRKTTLTHPFIAQRADPYIMHHTDGSFYFTASVPEYDRIVLRRESTLAALGTAKETAIWQKLDHGIMSIHIWAPELHYLDGAWYIYFAAGDVDDKWAIRPYALYCPDDDPLTGHWSEAGQIIRADDFSFNDFSLDLTVFEHLHRRYAVWAEKVNTGKKISNLYIAEMNDRVH